MIGVPHTHTTEPTGRIRLRASWLGRPVAQIEETHETRHMFSRELISRWVRWRDARRDDVVTTPGER